MREDGDERGLTFISPALGYPKSLRTVDTPFLFKDHPVRSLEIGGTRDASVACSSSEICLLACRRKMSLPFVLLLPMVCRPIDVVP